LNDGAAAAVSAAARRWRGLRLRWVGLGLLALLMGFPSKGPSAVNAELAVAPDPGWPQWRGPRRDGICTETGLLQSWPAEGPSLLWKTSGLGQGYSAPILTGGALYLAGDVGEHLVLFALDQQGRRLWTATNGASWKSPYPGARSSCTFAQGRLLHLNAHARIACYEEATGRELWAVDLQDRFGSRKITWATSECVLVDGQRVIVTVGGSKALVAALDLGTGKTVWTTPSLLLGPAPSPAQQRVKEPAGEADPPSYTSPILFTLGGRRHLVGCSQRHVFGVDPDSGRLLWTRPLQTRYHVVAMTPVLVDDAVFMTAPDTEDARLYRLNVAADSVDVAEVWSTKLDTCHGGVVRLGDALYGSWYRAGKGWACLDAKTGAVRYQTDALAKGSILYADKRLYVLSEEGEMALLRPTESAFEFEGKFRLVPERKNDVWTHPVILDGRLYLRYHDTLFCYDIRRP
jgi:outer membrane protein assembly factor BamB